MTGLLNKEAGWKHMRKYFDRMDSHDEAMLMFVDIDDFKTINDTYGHTVGDFWIREVASQLRHIYRQDDIICRYGGDEFLALIRNTASEQVLETTLGMFFQQLARTSEQHGQDVHCSVGVCRIAAADGASLGTGRADGDARKRGFRPMRRTGRLGAVRNQTIQQRNVHRLQLRPFPASTRKYPRLNEQLQLSGNSCAGQPCNTESIARFSCEVTVSPYLSFTPICRAT